VFDTINTKRYYLKRGLTSTSQQGGEFQVKIGVVGSINMDMTVTAPRIPNKGETLIGDSVQYIPGGKGANQAVAMARLGAEVMMFGLVGADSFGAELIDNLKANNVSADYVKVQDGISSGMAFITVGEQDNTIIVVPGANAYVNRTYIDEISEKLLRCDMVVLQHEISLETVEYVVSICFDHGIRTILNPAPAFPVSEATIRKVTYLTPNEHEAALIFGENQDVANLLKAYPEKLIITQGEKGVIAALKTGEILRVPARKAKVMDTTGAGDTLNGAFAVRISKGDELSDALKYANVAASLSTEKFGAQGGMPEYEEVEQEIDIQ